MLCSQKKQQVKNSEDSIWLGYLIQMKNSNTWVKAESVILFFAFGVVGIALATFRLSLNLKD